MTTEGRKPVFDVQIAGVSRTLLGGHVTISAANYTSNATIELWRDEGLPEPGDLCRVYAGWYPAAPSLVFTGEVVTVTPEIGGKLSVTAYGYLKRTTRPIQAASLTDGDNPPPITSYTDSPATTIIADILGRYGVQRFTLRDSTKHWGVAQAIDWQANETGESLIKRFDQAEHYLTFDGPDGSVLRIPWARTPGPVSRTWVQGVDIYSGRLERSNENTLNRVIATGLPQPGTTGINFVPSAMRDAPSPWIPSPPTYRAAEPFNSSLLEDGAACDDWCKDELGANNRIRSLLPGVLAVADPDLIPGMTVQITSAWLDTGDELRCLIQEVTHDFNSGWMTSVVLFVASAGAGWNSNQQPIAVIADQIEGPETLADGTLLTVVACDGGGSYDPDNNVPPFRGIVSFTWGGTAATPKVVPGSGGQRATYAIIGPTAGLTITLTVTDNQGATGSTSLTLGSGTAPLTTRDIWVAAGTALLFTGDGGATWQTLSSVAATIVARIAAADFTLAVTGAGVAYRVTVDDALTLAATAIATLPGTVTAVSINTEKGSARCWAGTSDGQVYQSLDSGQTWVQVGAVPNGASIKRIEESPFQDGDLTALAGNIAYHSFSAGAGWDVLYTAPAGWTITDFVAGFGKGFLSLDGTLTVGESSRIQERNGSPVGDWNTDSGLGPVDSPGAHPRALTLGAGTPVLCCVGLAPDGTPMAWWAAVDADFTFARGTWNAARDGAPNDLIRDGQIDGLVYCAADKSVVKSIDDFQASAYQFKALAAGQVGHMIGYGKLRQAGPSGNLLALVFSGSGAYQCAILGATGWHLATAPPYPTMTASTPANLLLRVGTSYYTWVFGAGGGVITTGNASLANLLRTKDRGATWTALSVTGVLSLAGSGDGTLYALTSDGNALERSIDGGDTWTSITMPAGAGRCTLVTVAHGNSQYLALNAAGGQYASTNGGGSWSGPITPGDNNLIALGGTTDTGAVLWAPDSAHLDRAASGASSGTSVLATGGFSRPTLRSLSGSDAGLFFWATDLYRSTDDGATWPVWYSGSGEYIADVTYDADKAEYYVATAHHVMVQRGGVWLDVTSGLAALLGGTPQFAQQGIAV